MVWIVIVHSASYRTIIHAWEKSQTCILNVCNFSHVFNNNLANLFRTVRFYAPHTFTTIIMRGLDSYRNLHKRIHKLSHWGRTLLLHTPGTTGKEFCLEWHLLKVMTPYQHWLWHWYWICNNGKGSRLYPRCSHKGDFDRQPGKRTKGQEKW